MPHHCYRTAAIPQQRAAALRRSPGGAAEGAPAETQVAALRFRCEARAPGCLHVVLEAVSPRAPYLLENRSGQALQYRQSGLPDLPHSGLPAYSAAGFAWQADVTGGGVPRVNKLALLLSAGHVAL